MTTPTFGTFSNGMAYARWGTGARTILLIPGGPGNHIPKGLGLLIMFKPFRPLVDAGYSLWYVARRRSMPDGYSIENMADDYAAVIDAAFGGRVDVVLGTSYGGMIAQYVAANHPNSFDHIVVAVAACELSEQGKDEDHRFAVLLSEGKTSEAGAIMVQSVLPGRGWRWLAGIVGRVIGPLAAGDHPSYGHDVLVEADAEAGFDARKALPTIEVPVLLLAGDQDEHFPVDLVTETARLIPDCTLRLYMGRTHAGAFFDKRLARDVLAFAAS